MRRPRWRFDSRFITAEILRRGQLGLALGGIGLHDFMGAICRPVWWHVGIPLTVSERRLHGLLELTCVTMWRDKPPTKDSPGNFELVFVDRWTGHWAHPTAGQKGLDLVSLAAWRLVDDDYAAARHLCRKLRLDRAHPDD